MFLFMDGSFATALCLKKNHRIGREKGEEEETKEKGADIESRNQVGHF